MKPKQVFIKCLCSPTFPEMLHFPPHELKRHFIYVRATLMTLEYWRLFELISTLSYPVAKDASASVGGLDVSDEGEMHHFCKDQQQQSLHPHRCDLNTDEREIFNCFSHLVLFLFLWLSISLLFAFSVSLKTILSCKNVYFTLTFMAFIWL